MSAVQVVDNNHSTMEMGSNEQVGGGRGRRKKTIWIIAGVSLAVIIAIVITLSVVLTRGDDADDETTTTTTTEPGPGPGPEEPPFNIDLDDIISGRFTPASFSGSWVTGNLVMLRNEIGDLILFDVHNNVNRTLVSNSTEAGVYLTRSSRFMEMGPDQVHVALAHDVVPVYRHSFLAHYVVMDTSQTPPTIIPIRPPTTSRDEPPPDIQNFVWGPQGEALAFVHRNNIYYKPSLAAASQPITTNGVEGIIYNGIPDWVYEEEVFSSNIAMWFSSDGARLAYATFDDTDVRVMNVPHYGVPGSVAYQYTYHHNIRYPKPGTTNPTVSVTLRTLSGTDSTTYQAPSDLVEPILLSVKFVTNTQLALVWANRVQNQMMVQLCSEGSTVCVNIFRYDEPEGWIENNPLWFNAAGNSFVTILPHNVGAERYKQVVQVGSAGAGVQWTVRSRSNTAHTVGEIFRWTADDFIWYKATSVSSSAEQHLYRVDSGGEVTCFTCSVTRTDGTPCLYNDMLFSPDGETITVNCAGPGIPQVLVYNTSGDLVMEWEGNEELVSALENASLPSILYRQVPIGGGYPDAEVQLIVPPDYESRTNIPLLVYVYAGPDTALVTHQWTIDWGTSLVARYGIAIAHIDGRGSGLRGIHNLFAVNRKLGSVEVDDQISVTRYLQNNLAFIDATRTCIWGWSYGGYASSLALTRGDGVFKCAIAVAPVTDWRFYDTIYTERYMDVPDNNAAGYAQGSLISEDTLDGFRNKSYFLVHGTADDNVHFQHAMALSKHLQVEDIHFTQMAYTDEEHGLIGVGPHLYHGLEKFLKENLLS